MIVSVGDHRRAHGRQMDRLHQVARHDWEHSHPLDLTDEGLFMDLDEHGHGGAEKLVLRMDDEHAKKHKK